MAITVCKYLSSKISQDKALTCRFLSALVGILLILSVTPSCRDMNTTQLLQINSCIFTIPYIVPSRLSCKNPLSFHEPLVKFKHQPTDESVWVWHDWKFLILLFSRFFLSVCVFFAWFKTSFSSTWVNWVSNTGFALSTELLPPIFNGRFHSLEI